MHYVWLFCLVILVLVILSFELLKPSQSNNLHSSGSANTNTWATVKCTEVLYTTFAAAQKTLKNNDFVVPRGNRFTVCKATLTAPPPCPACPAQQPCPAPPPCPVCPAPAPCPACNCAPCPPQKDCPACNCPAVPPCPPQKDFPVIPPCPPQKDFPVIPPCPPQKDCPTIPPCPTCPAIPPCPAQKDFPTIPPCPAQKDCPSCTCPPPTYLPQPIEVTVQGNVVPKQN